MAEKTIDQRLEDVEKQLDNLEQGFGKLRLIVATQNATEELESRIDSLESSLTKLQPKAAPKKESPSTLSSGAFRGVAKGASFNLNGAPVAKTAEKTKKSANS